MRDVSQRTASLFLISAHGCSVEHSSIVVPRVKRELSQLQISEAKQEVSDMNLDSKVLRQHRRRRKSLSSSLKCSLLQLMVNFEIQGVKHKWPRIGVYYTYSAFLLLAIHLLDFRSKRMSRAIRWDWGNYLFWNDCLWWQGNWYHHVIYTISAQGLIV